MTDPEQRYYKPEIRTAVGAPVHGSETTTPTSPEVDAHAQAVAAEQTEVKTGPSHRNDDEKRGGNKVLKWGAAGATVLAVGGGVAAEATNTIDVIPNWPANVQPGDPNTNPDNGPDGIDSGKIVIELSPESIADKTPEQLTEEFSIPAVDAEGNPVTPEAYLAEFTENYEGALNAGITSGEISEFATAEEGQKQEGYEDKMAAKYDQATGSALFTDGADQGGLKNNHWSNLTVAETAVVVSPDEVKKFGNFAENVELVEDSIEVTTPPTSAESGFDVTFTWNITHNAEELNLVDFYEAAGQDIMADERTVTYTTHIDNVDGNLKSTGLHVVS